MESVFIPNKPSPLQLVFLLIDSFLHEVKNWIEILVDIESIIYSLFLKNFENKTITHRLSLKDVLLVKLIFHELIHVYI